MKPFRVVIPHQIRAFVRETKGVIRQEMYKLEEKVEVKKKPRKNFDPVARYGTVDEDFKAGSDGLTKEEVDQSEEAKLRAAMDDQNNDWGLTYGKRKKIVPVKK